MIPPHLARIESTERRGVQAAISTETEKITQPERGDAWDSDAHKRIAVPRLCVLWEHPPTKTQRAKYAVLTPGPGMFVNVRNAPRVMIPPSPKTPRVSPCEPLCAIL